MIYGIAVDDAHHFERPWDRDAALPGQGWVVVRASKLDASELLSAMERGDFYASTGVELKDVVVGDSSLTITIRVDGATKHTTQFIGKDGVVLATSGDASPSYTFRGDEGYIRAKVVDSNGHSAWVQPVFLRKGEE